MLKGDTGVDFHAEAKRHMAEFQDEQAKRGKVDKSMMKKLPLIIAVDFDGTLVMDKYPDIGAKNESLFYDVCLWKSMGYKIILWTCRDGYHLDKAVEYCREQGLEFDSVNKNIPEVIEMFNNDTRKIYANMYIDDKNLKPSIPHVFRNYDPKDFKPWVKTNAVRD